MFDATYKAVRPDGTVVEIGDRLTDFRGESWIFRGITRHPGDGTATTGKVLVQDPELPDDWPGWGARREFYAHVFDLDIVPLPAE